jgi:hypothetical protein
MSFFDDAKLTARKTSFAWLFVLTSAWKCGSIDTDITFGFACVFVFLFFLDRFFCSEMSRGSTPDVPPISPQTKKGGLPPQLKALVSSNSGKGSTLPRTSGVIPRVKQPSPEELEQAKAYLEQATLMLKFRGTWEESINNGDKQKTLAFMSKAYKLISMSTKLIKQLRGKEKDLLWAATLCQSRVRARLARKRYKSHLHRYKVCEKKKNVFVSEKWVVFCLMCFCCFVVFLFNF